MSATRVARTISPVRATSDPPAHHGRSRPLPSLLSRPASPLGRRHGEEMRRALVGLSAISEAHTMPDLRFGVIGWGYWGPKIARNLNGLTGAAVTHVADMDENGLATLAISDPYVQTLTQAEDVFRSKVDAGVIATPVRTHYRLAKAALLHCKHVLVEKPLTSSVAEAEELVELAAQC